MEQNSCHQLVVDKQLKWERRQKANRKINVIGSNSTFLPQLGGGGLLNTRSNIQNSKTNPEKRQLRTGIYMYVHCSPVMASFLCRNFVWVEFEDIQHCLGFLNIWQIEKKKTSAKGLTKLCCQISRNIGCGLSTCTDQLQGTVF